ncbi:uncharacterized protein [Nicotiana tomentosiformis]|uniref:uncharacterized protein n=1 Tax=Nicotiana tomentosiformis TaxID=4098 RepID=UPI00388CE787
MADSTPYKRVIRGILTKALNFEGPSFDLQITQAEHVFAGSTANTVAEKRIKILNDTLKQAQFEKFTKESILHDAEKRRKLMDDDSRVKGKEADTGISSETLSEKEIKLFVKHPPVVSLHISSYTNTDIKSDLKEKLTAEQYKLFCNTCFGSFIEMKHCEVQHQLFREFAVVTSLNCVSDAEDFWFNTKKPNRIVETYFGGAKNVKKKDLVKCFDDKNWGYDNDGDAIKIALLYFIHTLILSSEKNCTTIPRLHFDLVESGRYSDYPWSKDAFQTLVKSISKKMDSQKKYYRIAGMPLAMQIKYSNIQLTPTELAVIQVPPDGVDVEKSLIPLDNNDDDSDNFSPTPPLQPKKKSDASVGPSSSPPHKKRKQQLSDPSTTDCPIPHVPAIPQTKFCPTDNIEFKETVLSSKKLADSKSDDLNALRQDLNSFKDYVSDGEFTSLRILINENFKKLFENAKANQNTERVYQRKKYTGRHDGGIQMSTEAILHNNPKCQTQHDILVGENSEVIERKLNTDSLADNPPQSNEVNPVCGDTLAASTDVNPACGEVRKEGTTPPEVPLVIPPETDGDTRVAKIFDKYNDTDSNASVATEEDIVCEYIRGYRLLANVPWHTIGNVLIPVNLKDKLHWILAVVSFKERCIKVYDSYRSAGHDAYVRTEIDKLAKIVPLYLSTSSFYRDKKGIDWSREPAYNDKAQTDPFAVDFISNVPQQTAGSIYGALLWDYAMRKIDATSISDNEAPAKIVRRMTNSDTSVKIVLE